MSQPVTAGGKGRYRQTGITRYGERIPGAPANFGLAVRFDRTDGYVGISQYDDGTIERVLLSPKQVEALLAFLGASR